MGASVSFDSSEIVERLKETQKFYSKVEDIGEQANNDEIGIK